MNCEQIREHLPEIADGGGTAEARSHVDGCAACQEQVRLFRETWRLMLAAPAARPSESFSRGVKGKIHGRANRVLRFLAPIAAAAAVLLVAVWTMVGAPGAPEDPVVVVQREVQALPEPDRVLFSELTADETTWELVENLDELRALDVVGADKLGQDAYLPGERK